MKALSKITGVKTAPVQSLKSSFFPNLNFGVIPALVVAVLPKCPLCPAAYLSALGFAGISPLQYGFWILPLMIFSRR